MTPTTTIDRLIGPETDPDIQEAKLLLLEEKRRRDRYICYWEPTPDQRQFWDQRIYEKKHWLILGGERSGKTELGAFLATVWLLGRDYFRDEPAWKWVKDLPVPSGPTVVRAIGLTADMSRDVVWEKLTGVTAHSPCSRKTGRLSSPPTTS